MTLTKQQTIIGAVVVAALAGLFLIGRYVQVERGVDYFGEAAAKLAMTDRLHVSLAIETDVDASSFMSGNETSSGSVFVPLVMHGDIDLAFPDRRPLVMQGTWEVTDVDRAETGITAETRFDATGRLYMRLEGFSLGDDAAAADLSALNGQWFTVAPDVVLSGAGWVDEENIGEAAIRPVDLTELRALIATRAPFIPVSRLEDEMIDGRRQAHYVVRPDPEALADMLVEISTLVAGRDISDTEHARLRAHAFERDYLIDAIVDVQDRRFTHLQAIILPAEGEAWSVPLSLTMKFEERDEPLNVEAPEGARPLKNLLTHILATGGR